MTASVREAVAPKVHYHCYARCRAKRRNLPLNLHNPIRAQPSRLCRIILIIHLQHLLILLRRRRSVAQLFQYGRIFLTGIHIIRIQRQRPLVILPNLRA